METVTHIIHDRDDRHQRTLGYRIVGVGEPAGTINVICAETRCHPNDSFTKGVARGHVNARLDSYQRGARSNKLRVFETHLARNEPTNAQEYRDLESILLEMADIRLPRPAALRS